MWVDYICEIKGETKERLQERYLINKFTKTQHCNKTVQIFS